MSKPLRKIVVIHTSDIHSAFQAMPRIAEVAEKIRSRHSDAPVLAVDCGDHLDRMSLLTEGSGGEAHLRVLEATGYDLVTLGNNEGLTLPKERVEQLFAQSKSFEVVCANLTDSRTGHPPEWMKRHTVVERDGIRIGFVGVTARYPIFYQLLGWQVEDPLIAVAREVARIRSRVDIVVLLSHVGLNVDKRMAEEIPGIDVILGGHTHHVLESPLRHGTSYLFGCGFLGKYVGEAVLYADAETGRFSHAEGRLHPTDRAEDEEKVTELIRRISAESAAVMGQPAAILPEPLRVDWERDSPFGNLLAAGIRKWTGAEIGVVNSGQILQSLLPGTVTKGMLLELCPSPVNPCMIRIKGGHLLLALEQSLSEEYVRMPIYGFGFRGKQLGGLCVDGMEIEWDSAPGTNGGRIVSAKVHGEPVEPEREYCVGTADMFTFGIGYLSLKEGREPRYFLPEFIRDVIERELNDPKALALAYAPRFRQITQL